MAYKPFTRAFIGTLILCLTSLHCASAAESIDFSLKDLSGKTHSVKQYRGKWIVVNFWASYCMPCLKEMPELSRFHDKHKDHDAVVLGINQEEFTEHQLARFGDKLKVSFPLFRVPVDQPLPFNTITIVPTTYLIDPQGKLTAKQQGPITMNDLEGYINRATARAKNL